MHESRYVGCIVGLAVGDALGYPAEFRSRAQILEEIGADGIADFIALEDSRFTRPMFLGPDHPPGTFTDDTQMSIAVAEALLAARGFRSGLGALWNIALPMPWVSVGPLCSPRSPPRVPNHCTAANSGESGGKSLTYIAAGYRIPGL